MQVYRLVSRRFLAQAMTGTGAALAPGRWNTEGLAVIYCATSRALAALEMLVHFDPSHSPTDLTLLTIDIPDNVEHTTLAVADLPSDWNHMPALDSTRKLGASVLAGEKIGALFVPSVVVPEELICILNPRHPAIANLKPASVGKFTFDRRLPIR